MNLESFAKLIRMMALHEVEAENYASWEDLPSFSKNVWLKMAGELVVRADSEDERVWGT